MPGSGTFARWTRIIERGLLVAGLVLFVVLLHETGTRVVVGNIRLVGWGIGLIVLQEVLAYACNSLGWWYAFPLPRPAIPFRRLLAIRLAGDAINYVTPTANVGGEFVRVRLLSGYVPTAAAVASVAIAKLNQTVAQVAFILVGVLVALRDAGLPPALGRSLFISAAVMSAVALPLLVASRRTLLGPLRRVLQTLGVGSHVLGSGAGSGAADDDGRAFHLSARPGFVASTGWFLVGWTVGLLEVYLMLYFLDVPVTVERVVVIEVFSSAIDGLLFFIPAKVGTQEGGKVLIFTLLGLDPAKGLSLGILRRIRELAWAGVGLLVLSRLQAGLTPVPDAVAVAD